MCGASGVLVPEQFVGVLVCLVQSAASRYGFRKRTIVGLASVQKSHKTVSRVDSLHPPPADDHSSASYSRNGATGGYHGPAATDDEDGADYVNVNVVHSDLEKRSSRA